MHIILPMFLNAIMPAVSRFALIKSAIPWNYNMSFIILLYPIRNAHVARPKKKNTAYQTR